MRAILSEFWPILVFACLVVGGHYLNESAKEDKKEPTRHTKEMHSKGMYLGPQMDTVEIKEHRNHANCPGLGCPVLEY